MLSLACPTVPTVMRAGLRTASRASPSTRFLNVAENSRVCLSGLMLLMMDRTWTHQHTIRMNGWEGEREGGWK